MNIPIYLVSLQQDVERREKLKHSFPNTFDTFIHIEAVDGRRLSAKEYYDQTIDFFKKYKRPMLPAELGCTLSHIKALQYFLETEEHYALILEDDVIGTDDDLYKISEKVKCLNEDSLLLCGGQEGLNPRYQLGRLDSETGIYAIAKFSYIFVFRTCCYVVTRTSAKEILDYHKKHITLADKWDVFFKGTKTRIYYSNILKHPADLTYSHIENDRKIFDKKIFIKVFNRIIWNSTKFFLFFIGYKKIE